MDKVNSVVRTIYYVEKKSKMVRCNHHIVALSVLSQNQAISGPVSVIHIKLSRY